MDFVGLMQRRRIEENLRLTARVAELEGLLKEARSEILHMGDGATEEQAVVEAAMEEFICGRGVEADWLTRWDKVELFRATRNACFALAKLRQGEGA